VPPKGVATPLALTSAKSVEVKDRVALPRVYLVWPSPAAFAEGDADLDLAATILAGGKSSRLHELLVFQRKIAQDVRGYQDSNLLGSRFTLVATAKPGHSLDELVTAIDGALARARTEGPTAEELEGARNRQLAGIYRSLDSLEQRADLLNHYQTMLGDPGALARDVGRYRSATVGSVRAALVRTTSAPRLTLRIVPDQAVSK
jgi:zinc protease